MKALLLLLVKRVKAMETRDILESIWYVVVVKAHPSYSWSPILPSYLKIMIQCLKYGT